MLSYFINSLDDGRNNKRTSIRNMGKIVKNQLRRFVMKKQKWSGILNAGTAIGLCAAVGIVLGALLQNVVMWLLIGAGIGVVLGAVILTISRKTKSH
jgi:hypothetical protein